MIKTWMKHLVLEKFINNIFDGVIDTFHKPRKFYTKDDFYIDQPIHTLVSWASNYKFDNAYITLVTDSVISINFDRAFYCNFYGTKYINNTLSYRFYISDVTEFN